MAHQRLAALRTSGGGMAAVGALEQGRLADLLAAVRLGHDLNSQRNWGPLQTGLLIGIQLTQKDDAQCWKIEIYNLDCWFFVGLWWVQFSYSWWSLMKIDLWVKIVNLWKFGIQSNKQKLWPEKKKVFVGISCQMKILELDTGSIGPISRGKLRFNKQQWWTIMEMSDLIGSFTWFSR